VRVSIWVQVIGLAREVFRLLGADPDRVRAVTSRTLSRPAPRPAYSVLGHDAWTQAGIAPITDWQTILARALPKLAAAERPNIVADPAD
jgi:dTDP-4-dehydrorhamnose reductase